MTEQVNLKISPELRNILSESTPERELNLIIYIEIPPPGIRYPGDGFAPDPKNYSEWEANARRLSELSRGGRHHGDEEVDRLLAIQRELTAQIDAQRAEFNRQVHKHNVAVVRPVRDAILHRLHAIEGVLYTSPEVGIDSQVDSISVTAKAYCLDEIAVISGIARIDEQMTALGEPGLSYSRPAIRASDPVQVSGTHGSNAIIGVLDTGVGPYLAGQLTIAASQRFTTDPDPDGDSTEDIEIFNATYRGHSTPVAGIIQSAKAGRKVLTFVRRIRHVLSRPMVSSHAGASDERGSDDAAALDAARFRRPAL